ncbi:hypothetical protein, partial [Phaeodactylibacter sp.]|uniref:hypothetical protein n=1 Tax=Phaeodactylibacter sp. TaxID=1940289 RepID=UPI0025D0991A
MKAGLLQKYSIPRVNPHSKAVNSTPLATNIGKSRVWAKQRLKRPPVIPGPFPEQSGPFGG